MTDRFYKLALAIEIGEKSFDDLCKNGIKKDERTYKEISNFFNSRKSQRETERCFWERCQGEDLIPMYDLYKFKYASGRYIYEAEQAIENIRSSKEEVRKEILGAQSLLGFEAVYLANAIDNGHINMVNDLQPRGFHPQQPTRINVEKILRERGDNRYNIRGAIELERAAEGNAWQVCNGSESIVKYEDYIRKFPIGRHLNDAMVEVDRLEEEMGKKRQSLLQCMKDRPFEFQWEKVMAILRPEEFIHAKDGQNVGGYDWKTDTTLSITYNDVLEYQSMDITTDLLVKNKIIPNNETLIRSIFLPDNYLDQTTIKDLPPTTPTDRTDVYFIGIPRSGKSCVIGSIIAAAHKKGVFDYIPHFIENEHGMRIDRCFTYYTQLNAAISSCNPPQSTVSDTLAIMPVNIRHKDYPKNKKFNPITIYEIGGEAFKQLAKIDHPDNAWIRSGAADRMRNNNKKVLCLIVDYALVTSNRLDDGWDTAMQSNLLESIITTLRNDGPDIKNPSDGCTMSKVVQVVFLLTKCDVMGTDDRTRRREIAISHVRDHFANIINTIRADSSRFGFAGGDGAKLRTFSLGKYHIGNSFQFDPEDALELIDFLRDNTKQVNPNGWWT